MADQENANKEQSSSELHVHPTKGTMSKIMPGLITVTAIILCAGAGFTVGRMFGTRGKAQTVSAAGRAGAADAVPPEGSVPEPGNTGSWYYDVEPVVANLNEPGVTRYVRVTLTLEISKALTPKDGTTFLDQKKPILKNWLTLYLSNQTIDSIRGERNLRQMQSQIADTLNQSLFPDTKPRILRVLFKELSIQ